MAYSDLDIQVTFGHVQNNIPVKIGQEVKKGQVIAYQGNTHNQGAGVSMDSHLHITTQNLEYIPDEWTFICRGINPFNIDIDTGKPVKAPATPSNKQPAEVHRVKKGETLYSISKKYNTTVDKLKSLNGLKSNLIQTDQVLKIKDKAPVTPKKKPAVSKPSPASYNTGATRGRSTSAYFKGKIDTNDVHIRNRNGSQSKGFNFNTDTGLRLQKNDVVYGFEQYLGWVRIYTGDLKGNGSNRWVWHERIIPTEVYK